MMRRKGSPSTINNGSNAHGSRQVRSWHFFVLLVVCGVGLTWNWVGPATSSVYFFGGGSSDASRMTTMNDRQQRVGSAAASTSTAPYVQYKDSMAYAQSFGFFDNLDDYDWQIRRDRAKNHKHQASPEHKKATADSDVARWYLANYYPLFTCPHQERVGSGGDGAKWVCDPWRLKHVLDQPVRNLAAPMAPTSATPMLRRDLPNGAGNCLIYSVGCHGNYVFEDGLVELLGAGTCEIHVFDLAQDYTREGDAANKNIHFHYWGLSSSYSTLGKSKQYNYLTMQQTMEKLGHVNRTIDVFKIDCEHCEWTTFKDWIRPDLDVRQLLIETHRIPVKIGLQPSTFFDGIEKAGFALFSKEPNIHPDAGGKSIEWSYLKLRDDFFPPPPPPPVVA